MDDLAAGLAVKLAILQLISKAAEIAAVRLPAIVTQLDAGMSFDRPTLVGLNSGPACCGS